jgi:hypothetical protein
LDTRVSCASRPCTRDATDYWITRTLYADEVGVSAPPVTLHTRTVTVLAADTNPSQTNPVPGSVAGETAADIDVAAPLIVTVPLAH